MLTAEGKKIGHATSNLCRVPSYTELNHDGKLVTPALSIQSYPPRALILWYFLPLGAYSVNHLIPKYQDLNSPNLAQREYMGSVGRIGSLTNSDSRKKITCQLLHIAEYKSQKESKV